MNATDIQLTVLEDLLNDDCKCEVQHLTTVCSYKVTHRQMSCVFDVLTCLNSALKMMQDEEFVNRFGRRCEYCGSNLEDCWQILPV